MLLYATYILNQIVKTIKIISMKYFLELMLPRPLGTEKLATVTEQYSERHGCPEQSIYLAKKN